MTILHLAAKGGNLEAVKYILGLRKINSNAQVCLHQTPVLSLPNGSKGIANIRIGRHEKLPDFNLLTGQPLALYPMGNRKAKCTERGILKHKMP